MFNFFGFGSPQQAFMSIFILLVGLAAIFSFVFLGVNAYRQHKYNSYEFPDIERGNKEVEEESESNETVFFLGTEAEVKEVDETVGPLPKIKDDKRVVSKQLSDDNFAELAKNLSKKNEKLIKKDNSLDNTIFESDNNNGNENSARQQDLDVFVIRDKSSREKENTVFDENLSEIPEQKVLVTDDPSVELIEESLEEPNEKDTILAVEETPLVDIDSEGPVIEEVSDIWVSETNESQETSKNENELLIDNSDQVEAPVLLEVKKKKFWKRRSN